MGESAQRGGKEKERATVSSLCRVHKTAFSWRQWARIACVCVCVRVCVCVSVCVRVCASGSAINGTSPFRLVSCPSTGLVIVFGVLSTHRRLLRSRAAR